jgi:hypothetical protein
MKSSVLVFFVLCLAVSNASAFCFLDDVECLAYYILPGYNPDESAPDGFREWSSSNGIVIANKNKITARFRFDEASMIVLKHNHNFGMEVEMVFSGENRGDVKLKNVFSSFPYSSHAGEDTTVCDTLTNLGSGTKVFAIHLLNLEELEAETDYFVTFEFEANFPVSGVFVKPGLQVLVDMNYLGALPDSVIEWIPWFNQFQYYALETDHYKEFGIHPDEFNGVKWISKKSSETFGPRSKTEVIADLGGQDPDENLEDGVEVLGVTDSNPENSVYPGESPENSTPGTTDPTPDIDVHIDKVTASHQGEENYQHVTNIYLGEEVRMEVDIENKGDEDIHVDIEYYRDDNKSFSFSDSHKVGEDNDVKIDHGTRNNGQPENVIEHKQHITFPAVGTYYLYVKVTTNGDSDKSASSNTREYAKVIVSEFVEEPVPVIQPTGKTWNELTSGEKAAVLQIILD